MEVSLAYSITLSLVLITFFTCAWKLLCLFWLKPKKLERCLRQQGVNGTPYRLLFQDLRDNVRMSKQAQSQPVTPFSNDIAPRILPFYHHSMKKYGKLCFTWLGPTPVLNIMDSDMLKEIFSRINEFVKPHPKGIGDLLIPGLVGTEGEKWAKHRKILNPAFYYEKLKHVVTTTCSSCEEKIRTWEKQSLAGEVDVWPQLQHLTGDVLYRAAFGSTYDQAKSIILLQQEQNDLTYKIVPFAFIPGGSLLPTKLHKRTKEINIKLKGLLEGVVSKREKAMKEGGVDDDDLLGLLLKSKMKEIQESGHRKGMSIEDVIKECKSFNKAGQEPTSSLLTWTLILLSKYQNWQDRARQEVLRVFGNNKPDFDGLGRLKIMINLATTKGSLLPTKLHKRMRKVDHKLKGLLEDVVSKREKAMKEGGVDDDDLLGLLLKSNMKEIQESGHQKGMNIEDVIQKCKAFNKAGQESTSILLTWTLSKYQNWQDRARQEVRRVFGNNKPEFDGLGRLKIVSMILNEVLRLYPPGFMTMRTVHKTTELGDIQIPPGVLLAMPMILIHHDPEIWGDDAKEFNPERFVEGVSKATNNKLCFFPFGWGPRTCIGQNFTFVEAKVALTLILQNFSVQLSPSYQHGPIPMLTPHPQYGVPLILTSIRSNPSVCI